jgi:hypothetical protein
LHWLFFEIGSYFMLTAWIVIFVYVFPCVAGIKICTAMPNYWLR